MSNRFLNTANSISVAAEKSLMPNVETERDHGIHPIKASMASAETCQCLRELFEENKIRFQQLESS